MFLGSDLQNALDNHLGSNKATVSNNGDGSFTVSITGSAQQYYIDNSGNTKSSSDAIAISSVDDLKNFRDAVNSGNSFNGKYVYLTNDITLDINEEWEPIGIYKNTSTGPDDENNIPFCGTFDGKNHSISGIYINSTEKVKGLFAFIKSSTIKNIHISDNCNISGGVGTSSLVGYAYQNSLIENCSNASSLSNSANSFGGIVGILVNSKVNNCYNSGNMTGLENNVNIGGIVGYCTSTSIIENSYNSGSIQGNNSYIGGISGYTYTNSSINNCYNVGSVSGSSIIGGITGYIRDGSSISNCYSSGIVTGNSPISGIVGHINNPGTITSCYYLENTINNSNDTSIRDGVKSLSISQLKFAYSELGSAFKPDSNNINNGYPILYWQ